MTIKKDPWYSTDAAEKLNRQKTVNSFLQDLLSNNPADQGSLYDQVGSNAAVTLPKFAEHYKKITGRVLPPAVRLYCYKPYTDVAANLVALMLPDVTTPPNTPDLWRASWKAAWPPY